MITGNKNKCRGCGQEIHFITSKRGRLIPCNKELITIITKSGEVAQGYISHFATCPNAKDFRK